MISVHEINHILSALDLFNRQVMVALDNEAMTEFARIFRDLPTDKWLSMRDEMAQLICEFISMPQQDWWIRWPDRRERTQVALAAWQLSSDLQRLLGELRDADGERNPFDPAWYRVLASESVLSLLLTQRVGALWPAQLGSPFQD